MSSALSVVCLWPLAAPAPAKAVARMFARQGIDASVTVAADARTLVELVANQAFDVAVVEAFEPAPCTEVVRSLRAARRELRVGVLTASPDCAALATDAGAHAVATLPCGQAAAASFVYAVCPPSP